MDSKLTIYDISTLSGVSIATVSRVLNGKANVNDETRERVEATIRKYGFVPQQKARKFRKQNLTAVGLMMNDIRNPYMCSLAYTINRELNRHWINTVLCNIVDVEKEFNNQLDHLIERKVNGVILMGSVFQHELCRVALERKYSGFPFVAINSSFGLPNVHEVIQDQLNGTKAAVEYLVQIRKHHIGYIYSHKSVSDKKKYAGFLSGMETCCLYAGMTEEVDQKTLEEGSVATQRLLKKYPEIDAIMYSADILAVGGVHYLNNRKIHIPDQIAIIGFNNSSSSLECYPQLTSIDNALEECGIAAVDMMIRSIQKEPVENHYVSCGLCVRKTTENKENYEDEQA